MWFDGDGQSSNPAEYREILVQDSFVECSVAGESESGRLERRLMSKVPKKPPDHQKQMPTFLLHQLEKYEETCPRTQRNEVWKTELACADMGPHEMQERRQSRYRRSWPVVDVETESLQRSF